jgi:hypothetical protein
MRRFWPSIHPSWLRPRTKAANSAWKLACTAVPSTSTPTRHTGSPCCARATTGHAARCRVRRLSHDVPPDAGRQLVSSASCPPIRSPRREGEQRWRASMRCFRHDACQRQPGRYLFSLAPGPPSFALIKTMPAFSTARSIASTVLAFNAAHPRTASPSVPTLRPRLRAFACSIQEPRAPSNIEPGELTPWQHVWPSHGCGRKEKAP